MATSAFSIQKSKYDFISILPHNTTSLHSLSRPQLKEIPQWILYYAEIQNHVQHTIYQFKEF